ncbi:hypothetical protein FRC11_012759 [Ceratobasidium sp. 423]|nr:hypothetical protein FRC11_012759 [Ceratobasidium sp. 423]
MKGVLSPGSTGHNLPATAILKLYDRAFANTVREEYHIGPPTHEQEIRYAEYLATGDVAQTEDYIWELIDTVPLTDPDPLELNEHLAALVTQKFFENEVTTYETLSSLQGIYIPTFYGATKIIDDGSIPYLDANVPGILIGLIPGSTSVRMVDIYSDLNALNRLENFIVKPNGSEIVMIDFGHCRLRKAEEDDQAWKEAKWSEEGAVGYIAERKYGWNYVPSDGFAVKVDTTGMEVQRIDSKTGKSEYYYL